MEAANQLNPQIYCVLKRNSKAIPIIADDKHFRKKLSRGSLLLLENNSVHGNSNPDAKGSQDS